MDQLAVRLGVTGHVEELPVQGAYRALNKPDEVLVYVQIADVPERALHGGGILNVQKIEIQLHPRRRGLSESISELSGNRAGLKQYVGRTAESSHSNPVVLPEELSEPRSPARPGRLLRSGPGVVSYVECEIRQLSYSTAVVFESSLPVGRNWFPLLAR